jgi:carboxymethylenebutenolidase
MCFDLDSRPPITPIAGGALDSTDVTMTAADGTTFRARRARAAQPSGRGIVILPDVRGLHPYYEELTLRFAEQGVDAIAIDYFGRTAGTGRRDADFEFRPHVDQTTYEGLSADAEAAAAYLRSEDGGSIRSLYTVGFCFGGRLAFLTATLGLDLAGVIGFYGVPVGPPRNGMPAPADVADRMEARVLGIFGGADAAIPPESIEAFGSALEEAGVDHRLITYPDAPHSFFDRKAEDHVEASAQAWTEVLRFVRGDGAATGA